MAQEAVVFGLNNLGEVNALTLYTTGRLVIKGNTTSIDTYINLSGFVMRTPYEDAQDRLLIEYPLPPPRPKTQTVGTLKRSEAEVAKPRIAEGIHAEILKESSNPKGKQMSPQKAKRKVPQGIDGLSRPSKSLRDNPLDHARTLVDLGKYQNRKNPRTEHSEEKPETESEYLTDDGSGSEEMEDGETESSSPESTKTATEIHKDYLKKGILSLKSFNSLLKPRIIKDQKVLTMPISCGHTREKNHTILRAVLCVPVPNRIEPSQDGHYVIQRSDIFGTVYLMDVDLKRKLPYSPSKFEELSGIRARKWHSSFKMDLNDDSLSGRPVRLWLDELQATSRAASR